MNKITFPITRQDQGEKVVNLQTGLLLLLEKNIFGFNDADIDTLKQELASESLGNRYGNVTQELIESIQGLHQLQPTGEIDQGTASALNKILEEFDAFEKPSSSVDCPHIVAGQIRRENDQPYSNCLVRAFHKDNQGILRLGEDKSDADGFYTIRYDAFSVEGGINLFVIALGSGGKPIGQSDIISSAGLRENLDVSVPDVDAQTYRVEGKVHSRVSASIGGLQVLIIDKRVGGDVELTKAETDESGRYQALFTDTGLLQSGKGLPDIQARVFKGNRFLGTSEVRYDASTRETLNVLLDEKSREALQSEIETLTNSLSKHFEGNLRDLKETDEQQDVTYLANKTGWDARAVALVSLADQFSGKTSNSDNDSKIESPLFYALFRAGLPANEDVLYQTDSETVDGIWKQSIEKGIIPKMQEKERLEALEQFKALTSQHALEGPASIGLSSLKEMLEISLADDLSADDLQKKQQQFAEIHTRYKNDLPKFWEEVRSEFGEEKEKRLKLDGQLAYLTLNNAPLIRKLHEAGDESDLKNPADLIELGYYRAEQWRYTIDNEAVPKEIKGANDDERRKRYAEVLAAQMRLSFPTAVVAQMVKQGETPLLNRPADPNLDPVHDFLIQHQGKFEIGMQPIEQYIKNNDIQFDTEVNKELVTKEITRIQRVYPITPGDDAMNALLNKGVDSSSAVVGYGKDAFIQAFKNEVGGEESAKLIYAKSQQVHNTVLNIALNYLTTRTAPEIGAHSDARFIYPKATHADNIIAYPTLERLFGEMDYCECEHCRSVLSPAAYMVDLLQFIDLKHYNEHGEELLPRTYERENPLDVLLRRRPDLQHIALTCENTNTPVPYIDLVNEALEHYITNDLSLDAYRGHNTTGEATPAELLANPQYVSDRAYEVLAGKQESGGDDPNFLLPPVSNIPFHRPLENLRRYFNRFEAPLPKVMEALRVNDDLERSEPADPVRPFEYGWRDIWMEELLFSRAEYARLTDRTISLQLLYGYPSTTPDDNVLADLSKAKAYTRLTDISYEELMEILKTRFVNPHSALIPRLERLGISFTTIKAYKDEALTDDQLEEALSPDLDDSKYGGDVKAWLKNDENFSRIMRLITLTTIDPDATEDECSFDKLEFRYANPDNSSNQVRQFEFIRLIRFIRLWRKLGWSIEQTDKAISALYPSEKIPDDSDDVANLENLDDGFLILLPRLGVLKQVMELLKLKPKRDLLNLLACFAPIDTHGANSLYREMFLSPALLKFDDAFADDGYGNLLTAGTPKLLAHTETLRAAFLLADDELTEISSSLGYDEDTSLTLEEISAIFRRGWLAGKLKLSVREFLALTSLTEIDPFEAPDLGTPPKPVPAIIRLIELNQLFRTVSVKPHEALYLVWNHDLSGQSTPQNSDILAFAGRLREGLAAVDSELVLSDDPDGQITRERMTQVYGNQTTDMFFGLLENTFITTISYDHVEAGLEKSIMDMASGHIVYDDFHKTLSWSGLLSSDSREDLKTGVTTDFATAIDRLYVENQKIIGPFFGAYPELNPLHDAYVFFGELKSTITIDPADDEDELAEVIKRVVVSAQGRISYDKERDEIAYKGVLSEEIRDRLKGIAGVITELEAKIDDLYNDNNSAIQSFFDEHPTFESAEMKAYRVANDVIELRRSILLENFLPELKHRRKYQYALQMVSEEANSNVQFAKAILENPDVLHMANDDTNPALADITAIENHGLSTEIFFSDTIPETKPDAVDYYSSDAETDLDYSSGGNNTLPLNPAPTPKPVSGIWSGYIQAPENSYYNFYIETDPGATVALSLGNEAIPLAKDRDRNVWSNTTAVEFIAGRLYEISLTVEKAKDTLKISWQTFGQGRVSLPARYLYPAVLIDRLRQIYIRFHKTAAIADKLQLGYDEVSWLASHSSYQINGQGWLNSLPIPGSSTSDVSIQLLDAFKALLHFSKMKADLSSDDDRLLHILRNPEANNENNESSLLLLTRWNADSLDALLKRFEKTTDDGQADRSALKELELFRRIYDAMGWIGKLGISAPALIQASTNEPDGDTVRDLQSALRARYSKSDWLSILQPINDELRSLQRNAMVAYILHQMRSHTDSEHIDTPEKLFEYFLMDVQMEPCMVTSRIRHALSSIQLFIERCLMDLEVGKTSDLGVSPRSINAKQWEWRSRYRVWEANRKVFLWPENWLEPELRDDQSPFFKETMSELLQSDITEERATVALLNYLQKLDEVAKLEPCGMHYVESGPETNDDVAHVVARTAGANRKYYYRRKEGGSWAPWEQIKLDIEDTPVIPVIWKGRLFLFWLRILGESKLEQPDLPTGQLDSVSPSDMVNSGAGKIAVKAILCWSECLNEKWQPTRTSDISNPLELISEIDPNEFDRSILKLSILDWSNGGLRVIVSDQVGVGASFFLYNVHSNPELRGKKQRHFLPKRSYVATHRLSVIYNNPRHEHRIFYSRISGSVIEVSHSTYGNSWSTPFFYEDSRHVFWISTATSPNTLSNWPGFSPEAFPQWSDTLISPLVIEPIKMPTEELIPLARSPGFGMFDPVRLEQLLFENHHITKGIGSSGTVKFGDKEIGPAGSQFTTIRRS